MPPTILLTEIPSNAYIYKYVAVTLTEAVKTAITTQ